MTAFHLTRAAVRDLDRRAIHEFGVPGVVVSSARLVKAMLSNVPGCTPGPRLGCPNAVQLWPRLVDLKMPRPHSESTEEFPSPVAA